MEKAIEVWKKIKEDEQFMEKYLYINWEPVQFLNKSSIFMLCMSLYNICSPLLSLLFPLVILVIPFIILKIQQQPIDFQRYLTIVKELFSQHAIGRLLFANFTALTMQEWVYLLLSTAFYIYSIYQNISLCLLYHNNLSTIHSYFRTLHLYTLCAIEQMTNYVQFAAQLTSKAHQDFNQQVTLQIDALKKIHLQTNVNAYVWANAMSKIPQLGSIFCTFYDLYSNETSNTALRYSFDFFTYIRSLEGIQQNITSKHLGFAAFVSKKKPKKISQNYYGAHKNEVNKAKETKETKTIKNNVSLDKNRIVTGPNASGKTTLLKSVLINTILTQQWGCGFYDSYQLTPFHYFHCYLNIPDTSGRDSLFQAEARRCKDILEHTERHKDKSHLCIFDEIYSGTNPEDATLSATRFLQFIANNPNIRFLVSTHFIEICNYFAKENTNKNTNKNSVNIQNCNMETIQKENGHLEFLYLLKDGISNIHGGLFILKEMNYPTAITAI